MKMAVNFRPGAVWKETNIEKHVLVNVFLIICKYVGRTWLGILRRGASKQQKLKSKKHSLF